MMGASQTNEFRAFGIGVDDSNVSPGLRTTAQMFVPKNLLGILGES